MGAYARRKQARVSVSFSFRGTSSSFRGTSSPETPLHVSAFAKATARPRRSSKSAGGHSRLYGSCAARVCAAGMMVLVSVAAFADAGQVAGIVVDSSGRPVPRALVQVMTRDGATASSIFTEADGSFHVSTAPAGFRPPPPLSGFHPPTAHSRPATPGKLPPARPPSPAQLARPATATG